MSVLRPDDSFAQGGGKVAETPAESEFKPAATDQRPDDLGMPPGTTAGVPVTDVDSGLSVAAKEPPQAEKPAPRLSYETVEGEPHSTTEDSESQDTSDDGRTITRRVRTINYYQPLIHRTLEDGQARPPMQ